MVIIGSKIVVKGKGDEVALLLAEKLGEVFGPGGKWLFLVGFWAAVFSSLLGVWQGVPYIFADFLRLRRQARLIKLQEKNKDKGLSDILEVSGPTSKLVSTKEDKELMNSLAYRIFPLALTFLPFVSLSFAVQKIQLIYVLLGAFFLSFLAATLLILDNRKDLLAPSYRNNWLINLFFLVNLIFCSYAGWREIKLLLASLF